MLRRMANFVIIVAAIVAVTSAQPKPPGISLMARQALVNSTYSTTAAPTTAAPTTYAPTTAARTTAAPTTAAPTTYAPTTAARTTAAPAPTTAYSNSNSQEPGQRPNILIFVADDYGHADVSYTEGNKQTPTPNIDKLAWDGIILTRHYSNPVCTPSRGVLMTSKYAFQFGMQGSSISTCEPWGLPLQFKLLPAYFKDLDYTTWHVGKWHLGEFTRAYYSMNRGFDYSYFFGYGDINFFNYTTGWITPVPQNGRELRDNGSAVYPNVTQNNYAAHLFLEKAEQLIRNSDPNKPWLMYYATPLVHTAIDLYNAVIHTMPQYQLRPPVFSFTDQFPERKKYLAMVQALDENFKRMTDAIVEKGIANNTIIVFLSDNGAAIPPTSNFVHGANHGSNQPLRHGKGSLYEGGIRTPSFIWSPLLKKRGRITHQLFRIADWLPTLYEAAGGKLSDLPSDLVGISQWQSFQQGLNYGPRKELIVNIDVHNYYSMIYEDKFGTLYKIISGNVFDNTFNGWWPTEGAIDGEWKTWTPVSVNCNFPESTEVSVCKPWVAPCLFDITNDPCETNNIAASYPSMVTFLQAKIQVWNATAIPNQIQPYDPTCHPSLWENTFVPWKDPQPLDNPTLAYQPFNPSSSF